MSGFVAAVHRDFYGLFAVSIAETVCRHREFFIRGVFGRNRDGFIAELHRRNGRIIGNTGKRYFARRRLAQRSVVTDAEVDSPGGSRGKRLFERLGNVAANTLLYVFGFSDGPDVIVRYGKRNGIALDGEIVVGRGNVSLYVIRSGFGFEFGNIAVRSVSFGRILINRYSVGCRCGRRRRFVAVDIFNRNRRYSVSRFVHRKRSGCGRAFMRIVFGDRRFYVIYARTLFYCAPRHEISVGGKRIGVFDRAVRYARARSGRCAVIRYVGYRKIRNRVVVLFNLRNNFPDRRIGMILVSLYRVINRIFTRRGRRRNFPGPFAGVGKRRARLGFFAVDRRINNGSAVGNAGRYELLRRAVCEKFFCRRLCRYAGLCFFDRKSKRSRCSVVVFRRRDGRFQEIRSRDSRRFCRIRSVFFRRISKYRRAEFGRSGRIEGGSVNDFFSDRNRRYLVSRHGYPESERNAGCVVLVGIVPLVFVRIGKRKDYRIFADVRSARICRNRIAGVFGKGSGLRFSVIDFTCYNRNVEHGFRLGFVPAARDKRPRRESDANSRHQDSYNFSHTFPPELY